MSPIGTSLGTTRWSMPLNTTATMRRATCWLSPLALRRRAKNGTFRSGSHRLAWCSRWFRPSTCGCGSFRPLRRHGTVPWIQLLRRHAGLYNLLASLGAISAAVFAFHPIVRHYLILPASDAVRHHQYVQLYGVICLYLVLVLALALLYQAAMRSIHRKRDARS